ncbi:MAG TPA: methyltransferase [Verrucomicrobia bacterium]|nr:MAG: hypothetical protein A2X46_03405 [Lentisphaerae bacterium GWF2_57_35]HBA85249.1 methyltransferase [Verrucomicrobiota bacterium]
MLSYFEKRATHLRESLEDPSSDWLQTLNTYRQFALVNRLFARWRHLYVRFLRPQMTQASVCYTLLDIGFGGGDIPLRLLAWAARDGRRLAITAIDYSERAMAAAAQRTWPSNLCFRQTSVSDLRREDRPFDFVISNHVLHELPQHDLEPFLDDSAALVRRQIVFNDVARSAWGAVGFALCTGPFLHRSFTVADGIISLRRAYTLNELRALAPPPWQVESLFPSRLLLTLRK